MTTHKEDVDHTFKNIQKMCYQRCSGPTIVGVHDRIGYVTQKMMRLHKLSATSLQNDQLQNDIITKKIGL